MKGIEIRIMKLGEASDMKEEKKRREKGIVK